MSGRTSEIAISTREPASVVPEGYAVYKRTPEFTEHTIPPGLLRDHSTKEGVWGLIRVLEGELVYRIVDARRQARETTLDPDRPGVIEPTVLHHIRACGATRFFVDFLQSDSSTQSSRDGG